MTIRDKHVLITGGSSGIGLALAIQCVEAGARLSLVSRNAGKLGRARDAILKHFPSASIAVAAADVSSREQVQAALAAAHAAHGPVDVLITSAGVAQPGYFDDVPLSVFETTMAVNYLGTVYFLKAVLPEMRARRSGSVVLISSGAGLVGIFGYTPYAPTKFALRGLAESLRGELAGTGVTVSIVYPPDTDTPQLAEENLTKPLETRAITSGGGLWKADDVARVTMEGIARGTFAITPGFQMTALSVLHSVLAPVLRWSFDRTARRARGR